MSNDLEALQARIAQLEARLGQATTSSAPPPLPPIGYEPEVRITQHISTLVGGPEAGYLDRDIRTVRQLVHALTLAYNVPTPNQHIPKLWLSPLRRLAAARASGLSWRAALTDAGLDVPDDLETRTRDLRDELDSVWDGLLATVAMSLATVSAVGRLRLRQKLEKLLG